MWCVSLAAAAAAAALKLLGAAVARRRRKLSPAWWPWELQPEEGCCRFTGNKENLLLCATQRPARDLLVALEEPCRLHMSLKSHFEWVVLHGGDCAALWPPLALSAPGAYTACPARVRAPCVSSLIKRAERFPLTISLYSCFVNLIKAEMQQRQHSEESRE